jgi:hypothetical protein
MMGIDQEKWKYSKRGTVNPKRIFQGLQDIIYRDVEEDSVTEEEKDE